MKYNIFLYIFLLGCLAACKEDEEIGFDVPVEFRKVSFDPVPGGAMMHYRLPDNLDIFGIRARYNDSYGKEIVKESTYLTDSLLLNGFREAQTDVPVRLTFLNNNLQESEAVELAFNTQPAATIALFDKLTVNPFWGGFTITYQSPSVVEGTVYVFYEGVNPVTKEPDNILIGSYPILEGGDTLSFELKQALDVLNVTVRTDDFDGNEVMRKTYEDIPALSMEMLSPDQFDFFCSADVIIENEEYEIGKKYLFDGKKKGANYRKNRQAGAQSKYKFGTFVAGPSAFGERFIVDLKKPMIPAVLRGDAFLFHGWDYPYSNPNWPSPVDKFVAELWNAVYTSRLPCKIAVYGTNATNPATVDLSQCALLYKLDEDPGWSNFYSNAWCRFSDYEFGPVDRLDAFKNKSDEDFEKADPISLDMKCLYSGEAYRYVFFVVEDTWCSERWGNPYYEENAKEYITFDELEVFVKMEND